MQLCLPGMITFARRLLNATATLARAGREDGPRAPLAVDGIIPRLADRHTLALLAPLVPTTGSAVRPGHVLGATAAVESYSAPEPLADGHVGTDLRRGPKD